MDGRALAWWFAQPGEESCALIRGSYLTWQNLWIFVRSVVVELRLYGRSEYGDRVDRAARRTGEPDRRYRELEVPLAELGRRPRAPLQIAVVEQPQTHRDETHGVNRHQHVLVPRRLNVLRGVGANQRDLPFMQPRQAGRVPSGLRHAVGRTGLVPETAIAGPQEYRIAGSHPHTLATLGLLEIVGKYALLRFQPRHVADRR